jgi:hypothetical protein
MVWPSFHQVQWILVVSAKTMDVKDSVSCVILINERNQSRPTIKPCWIPKNHKLQFSFTVINMARLICCSSIKENTNYMTFYMCMHYITHKFVCTMMLVQNIFNFTTDNAADPCYSLPKYNKYCLQKWHYSLRQTKHFGRTFCLHLQFQNSCEKNS